eukprot:UN22968
MTTDRRFEDFLPLGRLQSPPDYDNDNDDDDINSSDVEEEEAISFQKKRTPDVSKGLNATEKKDKKRDKKNSMIEDGDDGINIDKEQKYAREINASRQIRNKMLVIQNASHNLKLIIDEQLVLLDKQNRTGVIKKLERETHENDRLKKELGIIKVERNKTTDENNKLREYVNRLELENGEIRRKLKEYVKQLEIEKGNTRRKSK